MTARTGPTTPSATVGPYLSIGLAWDDGPHAVESGTPGAIWLRGTVLDGDGEPVPDALIETWQADPDGRFDYERTLDNWALAFQWDIVLRGKDQTPFETEDDGDIA